MQWGVDAHVNHCAKYSVGDDCQKKTGFYFVCNTHSLSLTAKHSMFLPVSALFSIRVWDTNQETQGKPVSPADSLQRSVVRRLLVSYIREKRNLFVVSYNAVWDSLMLRVAWMIKHAR